MARLLIVFVILSLSFKLPLLCNGKILYGIENAQSNHISLCQEVCQCVTDNIVNCNTLNATYLNDIIRMLPAETQNVRINNALFLDDPDMELNALTTSLVFQNLSQIEVLHTDLHTLRPFQQHVFPNMKELYLSENELINLEVEVLNVFVNLEHLDMSYNKIKSIPKQALTLESLKHLDLSHNRLETITQTNMFRMLTSLENLFLDHNKIHFVHPNVFTSLYNLKTLKLDFNDLKSLRIETFDNLTSLSQVYLGNNPWNCHCGILWIVEELQSDRHVYTDVSTMVCSHPDELHQEKISTLNQTSLYCEEPSFNTNGTATPVNITIDYVNSGQLHCVASGVPMPSIYWVGPRGIIVHPANQQWLPAEIKEYSHVQVWDGKPSYIKATVTALENGSLLFESFRYNFDGEYKCYAINPLGNVSAIATVSITTQMIHHLIWSVLFGGFCSVCMLIIGITVGSIHWVSERTCCKKDMEKSAIEHYYSEDVPQVIEPQWELYFRYLPYEYPDPTSRHSPMKCVTPAELVDAEENQTAFDAGIWQTLDDVRTSLRHMMERQMEWVRAQKESVRDSSRQLKSNVGKKVDRVKYKAHLLQQSGTTYVQSFRESSSTKIKNIKSSSSQYALRMKTGMVAKVEGVRGQMKSFKEFCGTGELNQTVSVMSVSTNVDSQETTIENKLHTIV